MPSESEDPGFMNLLLGTVQTGKLVSSNLTGGIQVGLFHEVKKVFRMNDVSVVENEDLTFFMKSEESGGNNIPMILAGVGIILSILVARLVFNVKTSEFWK